MAAPFKPSAPRFSGPRPNNNSNNGAGRPDQRGPHRPNKDENGLRINEEITASRVRLVGDNIQEQGIYSLTEAMKMADDLGLDLVEISAKADPPVCKIIDYQKYLYQQKKKAKEMKSNSAKIVIKEIRFGPNTDEHDFQFKLKHAIEFLQEGSKVKASVFFKGRSIIYSDQGEKLLLRFAVELEEYGRAEQMPKLEGKRMIMMIAPVKKK
ncbi:MAG: translation initiation factor IF-3 [Bacteroidetes bacterium]|uniref:Translation initiation factor IF-3 n=1 Tax=Candidatus Cryptobacteroides faecipullorum TaxID=2840764 RepID=A0A9D9IA79_9BACT|nr:translation initiation factor IF-3 [Candidatus Cryptobacteroides faecipullorum]